MTEHADDLYVQMTRMRIMKPRSSFGQPSMSIRIMPARRRGSKCTRPACHSRQVSGTVSVCCESLKPCRMVLRKPAMPCLLARD